MTSILHEPNGFGTYQPDGEFVDEDESLKAEFDRISSAELVESYDLEFLKFCRKNRLVCKHAIERAKPFQQSKKFALENRAKEYGDLMFAGHLVVSGPIKEVIQRFEPNVHQFWPIVFQSAGGKPVDEKTYYALLVLQARNAFQPELSVEGSVSQSGSYSTHWHVHGHKKAFLEGIAIDAKAVDGAHLWYEQRIASNVYFLSDELSRELKMQDFKLPPKFYKCKTV